MTGLDTRMQLVSSRFRHFTLCDHLPGAFLIRLGPIGLRPARSETRGVALGVHAFFETIDPAEANGLFHRRYIINGRFLGGFFILNQPDFLFGRMILCKPLSEFCAGGHVNCFTDIHNLHLLTSTIRKTNRLSDTRGDIITRSTLIYQTCVCRNWHLFVEQVAEASSGRSLSLSG